MHFEDHLHCRYLQTQDNRSAQASLELHLAPLEGCLDRHCWQPRDLLNVEYSPVQFLPSVSVLVGQSFDEESLVSFAVE